MKCITVTASLLLAACLLPAATTAKVEHPTVTPAVQDPGGAILGTQAHAIEAKFRAFAGSSGIPIVMIIAEKSPGEEEDKVPGAVMRAMSTKLGLIEHGVLVAHFPVDDDWRVWVGDELASRFARKSGSAEALTKSGEMHEAKEAWFEQVFARAEAIAKSTAGTAPDAQVKLGITAEAIADGLIERLSPQSVAD